MPVSRNPEFNQFFIRDTRGQFPAQQALINIIIRETNLFARSKKSEAALRDLETKRSRCFADLLQTFQQASKTGGM